MAKTTRRGENLGRRAASRRGATEEQVQTPETAAAASADDRSFSAGGPAASSPTREDIARRAYEIYAARGGTDGYDIEDWLQAERELRGQ